MSPVSVVFENVQLGRQDEGAWRWSPSYYPFRMSGLTLSVCFESSKRHLDLKYGVS